MNYEFVGVEFSGDVKGLIVDILAGKHGPKPGVILETGPYQGLGSSLMLAEAQVAPEGGIPHIALEAVYESFLEATKNLERFFWIEVKHALPTGLEEARKFVLDDNQWVMANPELPHDYSDPLRGYLWELSDEHIGLPKHIPQQNWFSRWLPKWREKCPLFFLDSGGGTGFLEFSLMETLCHGFDYYVILDDISHCKHYRSWKWIETHQDWHIFAIDEGDRPQWLAARHLK